MLPKLKDFFLTSGTPAFLVGGYLRDSLRSLPPGRDIDIAVAGDSQSLGRELARVL